MVLRTMTALLVIGAACDAKDDPTEVTIGAHPFAVAELTFDNIGSPNLTATLDFAVSDTDISSGLLSVGVLDHVAAATSRTRYLHATFRAHGLAESAGVTGATEFTLAPVATALTFAGTPVRLLATASGPANDSALAAAVRATGVARVDQDGRVVADSSRTLRPLADLLTNAVVRPVGVTHVFPSGFIVHADRTVTLAFSIPLLNNRSDNPTRMTILLLVIGHSSVAQER